MVERPGYRGRGERRDSRNPSSRRDRGKTSRGRRAGEQCARVSAAVALGAGRVIVLPTGFSCEIAAPPRRALGMALHGLSLLIAGQIVRDVESLAGEARIFVVPPLCPIDRAPVGFSRAGELIESGFRRTEKWLEEGGLGRTGLPRELSPHRHAV